MYADKYHVELFEDDNGSSFLEFKNLPEMVEIYETHSRWLLDFAEKFPGKYSDTNADGNQFYPSYDATEEPIWAAVWMAFNTGAKSDIAHAKEKYR